MVISYVATYIILFCSCFVFVVPESAVFVCVVKKNASVVVVFTLCARPTQISHRHHNHCHLVSSPQLLLSSRVSRFAGWAPVADANKAARVFTGNTGASLRSPQVLLSGSLGSEPAVVVLEPESVPVFQALSLALAEN